MIWFDYHLLDHMKIRPSIAVFFSSLALRHRQTLRLVATDRLVGYSDWSASEISVYVADSALADADTSLQQSQRIRIHDVVSDHVAILVRHLFLSRKPSRPAQSRWTGVPDVCNFTLSLALFHGLLKPLFAALSAKDDGAGTKVESTDADVWVSVFSLQVWKLKSP